MKKYIHILLLLVLPFCFIMLSLNFKTSKGEFYLSGNYDPTYVYLINSLNIATGYGVGHIDHPGTPVQELGAGLILIIHFFNGSDNDLTADVFQRPEFYISVISIFFILLNGVTLFILGFIVNKKLRSALSAIIFQLTPFFSLSLYYWVMNVAPEPLMLFCILVLISIVISYYSEPNLNSKIILKYTIAFGLICGLGVASKMSFFPVLIIPLILINRFSFKLLFCSITFFAFFIFVLPAFSAEHSNQFLNWVKKIIIHSGKYGGGERNFFDSAGLSKNLALLIINEPVFIISYILIFINLAISAVYRFRNKLLSNLNFKILCSVFAAITVQFIIVIKHFEPHYLIPAYLLTVTGLYFANSNTADLIPLLFKFNRFLKLSVLLILFSLLQAAVFFRFIPFISSHRDESIKAVDFIEENCKNSVIVTSYGASGKNYALFLGSVFGGPQKNNYYSLLKKLFPDNYYYLSRTLENVEDINSVKNKILNTRRIFFHTNNETDLNDFKKYLGELLNKNIINSQKIFSIPGGEEIYELEVG